MKKKQQSFLWIAALILFLAAVMIAALAAPQNPAAPPAPEALPPGSDPQLAERLAALAPEARKAFLEGLEAYNRDDLEAAYSYFSKTHTLAPGFPDALRRLSHVESRRNHPNRAVEYAQQAYDLDPSPYSQIALAQALIRTGNSQNADRAFELSRAAFEALPHISEARTIYLLAAIIQGDHAKLQEVTMQLAAVAPDSAETHFARGLVAIAAQNLVEGRNEILQARALGFSPEMVQEILTQIDAQLPGSPEP